MNRTASTNFWVGHSIRAALIVAKFLSPSILTATQSDKPGQPAWIDFASIQSDPSGLLKFPVAFLSGQRGSSCNPPMGGASLVRLYFLKNAPWVASLALAVGSLTGWLGHEASSTSKHTKTQVNTQKLSLQADGPPSKVWGKSWCENNRKAFLIFFRWYCW